MKSKTTPRFWKFFYSLPQEAQAGARQAYRLFRQDPFHNSLQFKTLRGQKEVFSVRIGLHYRAVGHMSGTNEITWVWIGTHAEYDTLIK